MPISDDASMSRELWAVTGATGYVGRALRADLTASGIASRGLRAEVIGDIRDRAAVEELVRGASVVVHLAAYVHRRGAADECWSINVDGTQTVIDAVAAVAPSAFLIVISSASVYGSGDTPRDESAPLQ